MRLLHGADFHIGLTRYGTQTPSGSSRIADFGGRLDYMLAVADKAEVDMIVLAGDTFHTRREGPDERAWLTRFLHMAGKHGITVLIEPGNHDGMTLVGDASSHSLRWIDNLQLPNVYVLLDPGVEKIETKGGPVVVAHIPYPHKRAMDALLAHLPPEERVIEAGRRVEGIIETLWTRAYHQRKSGEATLFVGHLTVGGAKTGSETTMKFSWDVSIRADVLAGFDYAALGHIHRQQKVSTNAWYAGSPEYIDFSEVGSPKGFLLVEFGYDILPSVSSIPSNARPMVVLEHREDAELEDIPEGAIVRVILRVPSRPNSDAVAKLVRHLYGKGASYVEVRVIQPVVESDRPPVAEGGDVLEATREWLRAAGAAEEPAMTEARALVASLNE